MGLVSEICAQEKKKIELNSNQNNFLPLTLTVCGIHTHLGRGRERYSCNTSFFASAKKVSCWTLYQKQEEFLDQFFAI